MRILFVGDVVGRPGIEICERVIPGFRRRESIDVAVINGENSDQGSGMTPAIYERLKKCGADAVTMGDHIYRKKDLFTILESKNDIVRPANFPAESPGRRYAIIQSWNGLKVAVISLLGRVFMRPVDCPFHAADEVLDEIGSGIKIRLVDFHAEATSDMQVMGRHLDGRVSAVLGTHTHVPTADESILPGGTAFQCDVGMTGPHESILGRQIERVMDTTITFRPNTFHVATRDVRLSGTIVDVDDNTGTANSIKRIQINEDQAREYEELT